MRRLSAILMLNILGIALFASWYLPENHGLWLRLDEGIFLYFNHYIAGSHAFAVLLAITNYRAFDLMSLLAMGLLYVHYFLRTPPQRRYQLISIGIVMLLSAVVLNQLGHLLPGSRPSPTVFFQNADGVVRVSQVTGIPTKDASMDSFPGDHGMMLMIFAAYMLRYFGGRAFACGMAILVLFSLPRVMIGAHWFSDIAVGSLSVVLVGLSWWLVTTASDKAVIWCNRRLPGERDRSYQGNINRN
ncbi:phosphatase PAP2 family protein [Acerihabitans arboris]|uniref:Lipid A 1-diphosphate synthase n=1 Tax=Acerihabitans arboris TaxID=2691583 RepID=A0A845SRR5_9GAMM|nr:phosphatase PAP2 family protein [Acerihabitans arboris]NDL65787.1 phosphatase PAP2 family protein [Acerihabitans arboris]